MVPQVLSGPNSMFVVAIIGRFWNDYDTQLDVVIFGKL